MQVLPVVTSRRRERSNIQHLGGCESKRSGTRRSADHISKQKNAKPIIGYLFYRNIWILGTFVPFGVVGLGSKVIVWVGQ